MPNALHVNFYLKSNVFYLNRWAGSGRSGCDTGGAGCARSPRQSLCSDGGNDYQQWNQQKTGPRAQQNRCVPGTCFLSK